MKLHYIRVNPSGNITLLVTDFVPRQRQNEIARRLMQLDPGAEQVGFLEEPSVPGARARLQMMGGEFCGNATMALAGWLARQDDLPDGEECIYPLEISGARRLIPCLIRREGEVCIGTVPMPVPEEIASREILPGISLPLVRFEGISHLIVAKGEITPARAVEGIAQWCAGMNADALGILFTDEEYSALRPLVYVRSTDSAVWENSCGSGTAAIGAYLAYSKKGKVQLELKQPWENTRICVSAACSGEKVSRLEISGRVMVEACCTAEM